MNSLTATVARSLFFSLIILFSSIAQNKGNEPLWKEMSKNKFLTTYYDLVELVAAKGEVIDLSVKTDFNSEQRMPGLEKGYFSEVLIYSIHLIEAKYLIKKASYFDGKGSLLKTFNYFTDENMEKSQMLPVTKGTHVYDLIVLHRIIHGKD